MTRALLAFLLCRGVLAAGSPVYVVLWFDTEDYVEPASDDAALRIATDLERLGVRATFKVVGEKARVLEQRKRTDVIRALARHSVGYHSNWHSIQPVPALYLRELGYLDGAEEFERRESAGAADVRRIFGAAPACYGQPGSSWGPQANLALRRMGIPVYLDEGSQIGVGEQPFWFGGMLYVFHMGRYLVRPELDQPERNPGILRRFDEDVRELAAGRGGVISSYYHPTEFVTTEFWDAVNFRSGEWHERSEWRRPNARTAAESERCYRVLSDYVRHAQGVEGTRFVTAADLPKLYQPVTPSRAGRRIAARHLAGGITWLETEQGTWSAADLLLELLGIEPRIVEGPLERGATHWVRPGVSRALWDRTVADVRDAIRRSGRLPGVVFAGSEALSLADFAATLAGDSGSGATVEYRLGRLDFERHVSTEAVGAFAWPIHPEGFAAPELLEMARLQAWTLKPARLR